MTYEEPLAAFLDIAYLAACAVNGQVPEAERVSRMDLKALYETAERHLVTCITAMALESAGVSDRAFTQAKGKAIRKTVLFDTERAAVLAKLEGAGIWHMPLKGVVLKDLYPAIGMRQMADNDILYDATRTEDVQAIMEGLGFVKKPDLKSSAHDFYLKPPFCSFEMHWSLFNIGNHDRLADYYRDVKDRLIRDEGSDYGYHFSDEDFYLYMIAHEYKHYAGGGTGIRSLLDTYVFLSKRGAALDRDYLDGELRKLGLEEFEEQNRCLAEHLFGGEPLTKRDEKMLDYIFSSGAYGTLTHRVKHRIDKNGGKSFGRVRYVINRAVLPRKFVKVFFPVFDKYPVLLPLLPFYRLLRGLTVRRKKMWAEFRVLAKIRPGGK